MEIASYSKEHKTFDLNEFINSCKICMNYSNKFNHAAPNGYCAKLKTLVSADYCCNNFRAENKYYLNRTADKADFIWQVYLGYIRRMDYQEYKKTRHWKEFV